MSSSRSSPADTRRTVAAWRRILRITLLSLGVLAAVLGLSAAGFWYWYTHRERPPAVHRPLTRGVTYVREVLDAPRPIVLHIVRVELATRGLHFQVTPGDPSLRRPLMARTTSGFMTEFDLDVAVNGDFFEPWHSSMPWDYYPHVGDPVSVLGFASSRGVIYAMGGAARPRPTLFLSADGRASFGDPIGPIYDAISGDRLFVRNGALAPELAEWRGRRATHPRTALALVRGSRHLIIIVVDGRQPNYSEGVTLAELADIVVAHGGETALNLDGGGSTTLAAKVDGRVEVLNSPIHTRWPGRERPVANHLGLRISGP